ncbi:MAG: hypothetical protein M3O50_12005 [Myxococcota bacterium]|nr:hypothetical protein [Myxococcota bacterium]
MRRATGLGLSPAGTAAVLLLGACAPSSLHSAKAPPGILIPFPPPHVTPGELDARPLFGEVSMRAARLGAGASSLVSSAEAVQNDWVGGFVDVPTDACLLAYARGSASIEDVDVAIYSEEGTQLGVDEGRDVHPTVLLCTPHPARVYVAAHVVEGEGLVGVGAQLVPKQRALIIARALGARGGLAEAPRPAEAWPGLEDAVRAHRLALGGAWEEFKRVALAVDARLPTDVSLPIDADQCVDAVVVPDGDVTMLDVDAVDGDGRMIAHAREGLDARTLTLCSALSVAGTLALRPHTGRGRAAVVLARARGDVARDLTLRPDFAWTAGSVPLDAAQRARDAVLAKAGYEPPLSTTTGVLALGRRASVPIDLRPLGGACARIDVVAGSPLALVGARIWDDGGGLLGAGEAASSLVLFACGRGASRLELETRGRPGPFAVTVRAERWKDTAFLAHPLAASRMLDRAATGTDMVLGGRGAPVRELSLEPTRNTAWTESVAAGHCTRVAVGAEGDGSGVELRAFDGIDGSELDRSEAAYGASVQACASSEASRTVRFEVRTSAGKLDAVVGERTSGKEDW